MCIYSVTNVHAEKINIEKLNFELGMESLNQNELEEAIKYFHLVLDKNPENVEAQYNIAIAYKKLGMDEESLKHLGITVDLLNAPQEVEPGIYEATRLRQKSLKSPNEFSVYSEVKHKENEYIDLGDMHVDYRQYEEAIEYYNLAIQINPYNDNTYFKVCKSYIELEDYLKAEPYIEKAVNFNPDNPRYNYYKDLVAKKIDSTYTEGIRKREELVLKNLNSKDIPEDYERELYENQWDTDEQSIETAFNQEEQKTKINKYYDDPDKKELLYEISDDRYDDFFYQQSHELTYLDLGDLHFDNRQYQTAVEYYETALELNYNNDYTHYKLSRCYTELGDYKKADEYIQKAISLSKQDKKYVYFKNRIMDRAEGIEVSAVDDFHLSERQTPEYYDFYTEKISKEPPKRISEKETSFIKRMKTKISSIAIPRLNISKLPGLSTVHQKIADPLEGKVEKFSQRRKQKQTLTQKEPPDFHKPTDYRETEEHLSKQEDFYPHKQRTISSVEKDLHNKAEFYNNKGIEFFKQDNLLQAEDYFKKAIQLKPMYAKGYNNLANIEFKRGNLEEAQQYALKSVEIDSKFVEGYYNLSLISKKQKDFENEIYYLDKAIEADPKYYEAYFARGLAHNKKGNYEKAKYDFTEVLKHRNDHFLASQNLGIIYANQLNFDQAERHLNHAIKLNKDNSQTHFYLGFVRQSSGKTSLAIENFLKAIELDPSNYRAYIALSKAYNSNSQPERALNLLKRAAAKNPDNAELYNYLGLLHLKFNEYEKAQKSFQKAVEKNPKRAIYHYNLSQSYLCMGDRKASNIQFQRAVNIIPSSIQDYTDLAEIFFDRGMQSYAIKVLKEGISNLAKNDYLFLVLADYYEKTGAKKAAINVLKEYLQQKPETNTFSLLIQKKLNKIEL